MKKRILTVLLAVCLVFALGTVSALAADGETEITAASVELESGSYIVKDDVTLTNGALTIKAGKTVILTLAEDATLTNKDSCDTIVVEYGGMLTINGTGTVDNVSHGKAAIYNSGTVTINGGTFDRSEEKGTSPENSGDNSYYVILNHGAMTINNATINQEGSFSSMIDNGYYDYSNNNPRSGYVVGTNHANPSLTIYNGYFSGGLNTVKNDDGATLTIHNGTFENVSQAIVQNHSSVTINGGTFEGGETTNTVYGIDNHGISESTVNPGTLTINGGSFSNVDYGIYDRSNNNPAVSITDVEIDATTSAIYRPSSSTVFNISGGNYKVNGQPDKTVVNFMPDDTSMKVDDNGDIVVDTETTVATVNGVGYSNLQEAINAAPVGGTVTLLKDIHPVVPNGATAGQSGAITINKNITIDGKNLQIIADDGSFATTGNTGNFHVINITGGNVTIKNLNIDGCDKARSGINVWGNGSANPTVTIEDTDIKDCTTYAVTIGSATVTADGLRTSGGGWGGVNVDTKNGDSSFTMESGTLADNYSVIVGEDADHDSDVNLEGGNYSKIQVKVSNTDIDISGGSYEGIEVIDGVTITDQISITGGTFEERQPNTYVDTDYVAYNSTTGYTYTDNLSTAMNAAGQNGTVDYVAGNGWDVTLYYDKDVQTEIEVPKDYTFRLPGGTFEGKQIEGWKYGSEVFEPGDTDKITSDRTYYVILRNGQYNIVIDDDIKHGDVSTDVSSADKGATVYIYVDPDIGYVLDDLDVYYGANNRYSVTVSYVRAGVYKFTMPNASVYITATFKYAALPFTDVNRSQWFYDEVFYVYTNGMMEGDSATTFNPDGRMTRAMFWAVLGRIDGATITGNDWAEEARAWAMREGVSDGTNPNDYVTREQMVTMLWRYAGEKNGSASLVRYTDADKISSYAVEAMRWAIGNGIIEGMTSTTLEPQGTATRAQCAAIFMRFDQM